MRRSFTLPLFDEEYLNRTGFLWETINEGGLPWVLIHEYPVPNGYCQRTTSVALLISPGYPDAQLDMAYFNPALSRIDNKHIGATCIQQIDGKSFQRWSRHRTGENPWRPGIDDIASHMNLVAYWLEREFR